VPIYPVRSLIIVFAIVSMLVYMVLLWHFVFGTEPITDEEEGKAEAIAGSQI